jgi:hypothetical protein
MKERSVLVNMYLGTVFNQADFQTWIAAPNHFAVYGQIV